MNLIPRQKDHTHIGMMTFISGKYSITDTKIYFKDIDDYEDLPDPCKCQKVKEDFERYKQLQKCNIKT